MTLDEAKTLKKGDPIRCIEASGSYTPGKLYEVGEDFGESGNEYGHIATTLDNYGSTTNGCRISGFEKVKKEGLKSAETNAECRCSFKGLGHDLDCEYVKAKNAI